METKMSADDTAGLLRPDQTKGLIKARNCNDARFVSV